MIDDEAVTTSHFQSHLAIELMMANFNSNIYNVEELLGQTNYTDEQEPQP